MLQLRYNIALLICTMLFLACTVCFADATAFAGTPPRTGSEGFINLAYDRLRPFELAFEFCSGLGTHESVAETQRPSWDLEFDLNPLSLWVLGRLRLYWGPVGLLAFIDSYQAPILPTHFDVFGPSDEASSTSLQLLATVPVNMFAGRLRLEPLVGHGWLTDKAHSSSGGLFDAVEWRESYHGKGLVFGLEPVIRMTDQFQVRGTYTYGDYSYDDRRFRFMLEFLLKPDTRAAPSPQKPPTLRASFLFGFQTCHKGDGRTDQLVFVGAAGYFRP